MTIMMLFGNKKHLIIILFIILFSQNSFGFENKILIKLNNKIITTIDVKNEEKYLKTLNKNFQELDKNSIQKIAIKSLIRENVKLYEILKYTNKIELEEKYFKEFLKLTYSKLGFKNEKEFLNYINETGLNFEIIKKKLTIEAIWNQIILSKFSKNINIDEKRIKKKIESLKNKETKSYLLSEILINIKKNTDLKNEFNRINQSISKIGFENTALSYSGSESSKMGGKIGWIEENMLSEDIKNELQKINIGETSNFIKIPSGFLILKINDIKFIKNNNKIDERQKFKEFVNTETNKQLNQYSNIYFEKIKKDVKINKL